MQITSRSGGRQSRHWELILGLGSIANRIAIAGIKHIYLDV